MAVTINGTTGITTPDITTDSATVDTTTLVVDEANNRVGIGTASPTNPLHVLGGDNGTSAVIIDDTNVGGGRKWGIRPGAPAVSNGYLTIHDETADATRLTITDSGNVLVNATSASARFHVVGDSGIDNAIFVAQNGGSQRGQLISCTAGSFASNNFEQRCTRANTSAYFFIRSFSSGTGDQEFYVRGDGQVGADGSFFGGGADYAEYFEWSDGNTSNEDRRGYTVVLDGNKVRKATDTDDTSQIIGAVSSKPSVVGDADMDAWKYKYLKDDFGQYIRNENGERILNTAYDESQEYTPREDRPEWDAVGLMGKLRIRKGQPVGDRWIKMRDISETVEEWLVR